MNEKRHSHKDPLEAIEEDAGSLIGSGSKHPPGDRGV